MEKRGILVAGATGYLGSFIWRECLSQGYSTSIITRKKNQDFSVKINDVLLKPTVIEAQVTKPKTLEGCFKDINVVISSVGITRQKDGLTYMDVDYQANVNLIEEAKKSGVKKFIYVSVFHGEKLRNITKICEAKEKLVDYLKESELDYCIIRPNGFFSDMKDFLGMAKDGKVYLFGNGDLKMNPIHGEDLAKVIVDQIKESEKVVNIGGPDLLTQNQLAELALKAFSKPITKIVHFPDWIRKVSLWGTRTFTTSKTYGPIEFFLTAMALDMSSPQYGTHKIEDFFIEEAKKMQQEKKK